MLLGSSLALIISLGVRVGLRSMLRSATYTSPKRPQVERTPDFDRRPAPTFNRQTSRNRVDNFNEEEEDTWDVPGSQYEEDEDDECDEDQDEYCWDDWESPN